MLGNIFSIEEFSVYDGPGIRTSIFLKGCPLRCSWCHNPEGQSVHHEIVRSPNGCLGCGACERYGVKCGDTLCYTDESIKNCPVGLLRTSGEYISSADLVARILKNEKLLNMNSGGVTFSGGEPLMQSEFVIECATLLRGRLHTAVQTSGYCDPDSFRAVAEAVDMFLFDLKIFDAESAVRHTGVSSERILRSFDSLVACGKPFTVRIPLIPTVTDTEDNIRALCSFMRSRGVGYAELMPYNTMAGGKYKMLGRNYEPTFDSSVAVCLREEIFSEYGIRIRVM